MITEALVSLNERTGSSHYAIAKHIEERQKVRDLPPNFRRLLFVQLKKFVASGKLVKVKNSFKLPPTAGKKEALKKAKAVTLKSPAKKMAPVKVRKLKSIKSPAKKPAVTKK
uniref:H15 domain-containing protein n=2 Tax=Opuntia streptacantha TaxID=393608 RepID=A0A7C9DVZ9_OPUST